MSRIALLGCTSLLLLSSVLQVAAAPPAEQKRRAAPPAARIAAKPVQATRPPVARIVRPIARPVSRPPVAVRTVQIAPKPTAAPTPQTLQRTAVKSPAKVQLAAKPVTKPVTGKPEPKQATLVQRGKAPFDRSTRSNLLPAGSTPLVAKKGPQPLPAAVPGRASTANKVAGAVAGAALISGGLVALGKPTTAAALVPTGPVRPAARLPLANLNHPHVKPVARVLPSIVGHKNANRPRLPLFVLAPVLLGASWMGREFYVWNRRSYDNVGWIAPIPSCYVGGTVFYRNPWTGDCFNFDTAEPGDRFAVGTKVYAWAPSKYPSVEDMVDDQERVGASVLTEPFRVANPTPPVSRVSAPVLTPTPTAAPQGGSALASTLDVTDCSSCLTAIGPVEVTGGQCSVTISNNCSLPVAFDVEFQRNDQTFCQTKLDAASASEVIVCTQPCTTFLEARVNLKSAIPKFANSAPFKGCRPHWAAVEEQVR